MFNLVTIGDTGSELLKFLKKEKLDSYYNAFVDNGGDDLDYLLKADDQELDEILSLVGMDSKRIHKMRFTKALNNLRVKQGKVATFHVVNVHTSNIEFYIS